MEAKQFQDSTDRSIACGPLDQLDSALKHCWDPERLSELRKQMEADYTARTARIINRINFIRSH